MGVEEEETTLFSGKWDSCLGLYLSLLLPQKANACSVRKKLLCQRTQLKTSKRIQWPRGVGFVRLHLFN